MKTLSILVKLFLKTELNFSRSALIHTKAKVCLKYFVNYCLWKQFLASNSLQNSSNLICLTIFVTLNLWHSFNLRLQQIICKEALKFVLLDNNFPGVFSEAKVWYWKPFKFGLGRILLKDKVNSSQNWLLLKIKAGNKDIKSTTKFFKISCSKYFEIFWWVGKFCFPHKWKEAWLLVIKWFMRIASRVPKRLKT